MSNNTLLFTKMHGLGNDFVVIDATQQRISLSVSQIQRMADRHFGIGFDQLLLVEKSQDSAIDFYYRIFNADGSEVEQCGNGARCFAYFVHDKGLCHKSRLRVATMSGVIELLFTPDKQVVVDMGMPKFAAADIPFITEQITAPYTIDIQGKLYTISVVNMGNPHAVLFVDALTDKDLLDLAPLLESHPQFPKRVNVGFAQLLSTKEINLRVYERGAGETLACGTGACAAVAAGINQGILKSSVTVHLRGGDLHIQWMGGNNTVKMTGSASKVFDGCWFW